VGVGTPILADLILSGDRDALAGYYDGRAPSVYQYCAQVCHSEQVEEAVLAAFADFLGRVRAAGPEADLDDLLRKSTRTAAASRMQASSGRDATCRSMPELIVARANDELPHDEGPIKAHLDHCRSCRQAAKRLIEAEDALVGPATRQPPEEVRTAWLLIASRGAGSVESEASREVPEQPVEPAAEPAAEQVPEQPVEPAAEPASETAPERPVEPAAEPAAETASQPPADEPPAAETPSERHVTVRRRTGGLIGAARRVASSTRRR
jgi:chemotaxis protein histidine kinase CheA